MTNPLTTYKNSSLAYAFGLATMLGFSVLLTLLQQNGVLVSEGLNFWLINGAYSLCLGAVGLLILKLSKQPVKQTLGIRKQAFSPKIAVLLCVMAVVLLNVSVVANDWFLQLLTKLGCDVTTKPITNQQILQNPVLAVVVACILPAINEELLFRGLIAKGLQTRLGNTTAIVLTGLLFALFHGSPAQTLHQFAFGSMLAYVAIATQSIILPVIAHLCNNLAAMLLALYVEPTGVYQTHGIWFVLIGGAILAVLAYVFNRQIKLPQPTKQKINAPAFDLLMLATSALCVYLWVGAL